MVLHHLYANAVSSLLACVTWPSLTRLHSSCACCLPSLYGFPIKVLPAQEEERKNCDANADAQTPIWMHYIEKVPRFGREGATQLRARPACTCAWRLPHAVQLRLASLTTQEKLVLPYLDLKIEYYDLGLPNRDKTNDKVTEEAAYAILVRTFGKLGAGDGLARWPAGPCQRCAPTTACARPTGRGLRCMAPSLSLSTEAQRGHQVRHHHPG